MWDQALSRVWVDAPIGWLSIYVLDADSVPILAGVDWLDQHDVSFRKNLLHLYDEKGEHAASLGLRRGTSGHRLLDVAAEPLPVAE